MVIRGLYGDEAITKFAPSQFVSIYEEHSHHFYCEATVETLPEEVRDDLEGYFLEPTDELGQPIPLRDALAAGLAAQQ